MTARNDVLVEEMVGEGACSKIFLAYTYVRCRKQLIFEDIHLLPTPEEGTTGNGYYV
jgi:hypothetical protein